MAEDTIQSLTANRDIDYIQKDFDSVVDGIINLANVNFGPESSANREWTDFNSDAFSRNWLEIVAFVADVFYFYFDQQATQSYLQTATIRASIRDIAKQFGFLPATASSASGNVTFTFTGAGTLNRGFKVASSSGVQFFLTDPIVAGAAGEFTGTVLQGEIITDSAIVQGIQNEEFNLTGTNVIIDSTALNVNNRSPILTVNGNTYTLVESFINSNGTDGAAVLNTLGEVVGGGGRVFQLEERPDGTPFIRFGDGIFGRKLLPGETVSITYRTGGGSQGNISKGAMTTLVDNVSFVTNVTNTAEFSGGADEQSIEQLRDLIPASLRTLERAVSKTDYSDLIISKFSEVLAASTENNTTDPSIDLNIYVVPQGNSITAITENTLLFNRLTDFVDTRKMVTVQFQILDAFGIGMLISLEVFITNTTSRAIVSSAIQTAITNLFNLNTGGISGAGIGFSEDILLKDINTLIKDIEGIERFEIKKLSYRPRIQQNVQGLVTTFKTSEVDIFSNVGELEWLVASSGTNTEASGNIIFPNTDSTGFSYDSSTGKITYTFPVLLDDIAPGDSFRNGPGLFETLDITTRGDGAGVTERFEVTTRADEQGIQETSTVKTISDVSGSLAGTFFVLFDEAGSVGVWIEVDGLTPQPSMGTNRAIKIPITSNDSATIIAGIIQPLIDADSKFSASVLLDTITIQNAVKLTVSDIVDGAVPTNFTLNTTVQGVSPNTLGATYFDIADSIGPVRVWFDISGAGTTAPSSPVGGRLLGVTIDPNETSNDVASKLQAAINVDPEYSATVTLNTVTITNASVGLRTGPTDGAPATNFTFNILFEGADPSSLDGQYFIIPDIYGGIAFWFDVDDNGTAEPAHGQSRSVEITSVTSGMGDNLIAAEIEKAITSVAPYTSSLNEISRLFTVEDIAGSLNNKYFLLNSENDTTEYYVWYNVNAAGIDPSLAGKTGIAVPLATGATANTVASTTSSTINSNPDFTATNPSGNEVQIVNVNGGKTTDIVDAVLPNNTGFSFEVTQQGATISASTVANVVTVTHTDKTSIDEASAGTSGFTITTTQQGVADNTDFSIKSVDIPNSVLYLDINQPVNPIAAINAGGSIRNGATTFEAFKVFSKILATATNLSIDSITDSSLDLSVKTGTGTVLSSRILIDNTKISIPNEYANSEFYIVDGAGNIWEIEENTSNTIKTSITAVNDASISAVSGGDYKIVTKLVGRQIVFNESIFNIQYNNHNTIFSAGAQFTQIGTIRDEFQISEVQTNQGKLGIPADLISFNLSDGEIRLNESPDLQGISSGDTLIDSLGQIFSIIGIDNRALPLLTYLDDNQNDTLLLKGSGVGNQYSQGFQVVEADTYSVVSMNLVREGNVAGSLTAKIVLDDGTGLPDVTQVVAISNSVAVTSVDETLFEKVIFPFTTPPSLLTGTQYHLILSGDVAFNTSQQDNITIFNNTGAVAYTYEVTTGLIEYASAVNLTGVIPGHFFEDGVGTLFKINSVDNDDDTITLDIGLTVTATTNGNVIANDNIKVGVDNLAPSFGTGEMSQFDGSVWSNSSSGPNQFSVAHDMIFSIEGPKSIKIESNLTPVLGSGATISTRYYDDNNQVSFIIGLASGTTTSATDVNAIAKGTISGLINKPVDNFVFRTSRFADDVVNLRANEIPQIATDDIELNILGGVE